jgi:hypothetical protein
MKAVLSNMKNWLCIIYFLLTPFFALANPFTWEEQVDTVSKQQVGFSYFSDTIKSSVEKKDYKTIFAIKSNLLYDLATMVNVSVEVPFVIQDNHFSVVAQHQFPWWLWGIINIVSVFFLPVVNCVGGLNHTFVRKVKSVLNEML